MSAKGFISVILLTLTVFNIGRIIGWRIFGQTDWWNGIIYDDWHHYQLGILLLLVTFLVLRKKRKLRDLILAVGSGMVIDESMYLLYPLNENFKHGSLVGIGFEFLVFAIFALIIFRFKPTRN